MNEIVAVLWAAAAGGFAGVLISMILIYFSWIVYEKIRMQTQNWRFGKNSNNISNVGIRKKYDQ